MEQVPKLEMQPNERERVASYRDPQLRVLFAVTLMGVLGVASIGPALPKLRVELGVPTERIGLVVTMFTLPGVFLTPLLGIVADRLGRKRVLVPSLVLFGIAGAACSLAQSVTPLLALRLLQIGFITFAFGLAAIPFAPVSAALVVPAILLGLAFATTIPVVMSLLAALAPDDRRAAFMSLNGTVLRLGQTLGPVIMTGVYAAGGFRAVYMAGAALAVALAALTAAVLRL